MIHIQSKRYQIVLWPHEASQSDEPALKLDFDTLENAQVALYAHEAAGLYRSGMLMEWHKPSGIWNLLEQFS